MSPNDRFGDPQPAPSQAPLQAPAPGPRPAPAVTPVSGPDFFAWIAGRPAELAGRGPVAILMIEDEAEVASTIAHYLALGFPRILALSPDPVPLTREQRLRVTPLRWSPLGRDAHVATVNAVIAAVPEGTWLHYAWNAEYLFFPFCETRRIGDLLAFHTEERRDAMVAYVVDLYPGDRDGFPDRIDRQDAMLDASGYYAVGRRDKDGHVLERQYDIHGGLRWRYEEYLPRDRLRLDRVALFRAMKGLRLGPDHRLSIEEMNTVSCPWHHNLTAAVASFRVAKALARNPRSRRGIDSFAWSGSVRFEWSSRQLMDLGMMEPGQWF